MVWWSMGTNSQRSYFGWGTSTTHTGTINEMTDNAWEQLHTSEAVSDFTEFFAIIEYTKL